MWRWLRHRYLAGFKFRRQHPIGRYFLDFYCAELRLAIELDGSGHEVTAQIRWDEARTRDLGDVRIAVVRLRNEVVLENPDGAWEMIAMAVATIIATRNRISPEAALKTLLSPQPVATRR